MCRLHHANAQIMIEPKSISISEAQRLGFSHVIRVVEEEGMLLLERHHHKVAFMIPATPAGFLSFFQMLIAVKVQGEAEHEWHEPDFTSLLAYMVWMLEKKLGIFLASPEGEKDRPEDRAMQGCNPSAVSMEGKGRRRKPAVPPKKKRNPPV